MLSNLFSGQPCLKSLLVEGGDDGHWGSELFFSRSVVSDFLQPHGLQHAQPPCPSPSSGVCPSLCPLNQ